jgi:hypothetical protein
MRYEIFLRVIDQIRKEAPQEFHTKYLPNEEDTEKVNQARSRAFIHLYLKVMFGITDFKTRENTITDRSYDGGIDGYFISEESKKIYLIQSKFRTTEKNFEEKEIMLEEILAMDINRILQGEEKDDHDNPYNGKIKQLQREISQISDIARYDYSVAILANSRISPAKAKQLTGGYAAEIFNFERTYRELVFPIVRGTYFTASDISIPIDLSQKNSGSKISYNVSTRYGNCEITVLFVPAIEIAKLMHKYKNSILTYNPRSYLELQGKSINTAIRETILNTDSNEFALFNNGITMLSDETNINEKIGQKNKAQLYVKNPQIINGGQTSFSLSRIYAEDIDGSEKNFLGKEVLLKVITLVDTINIDEKMQLIDDISNATNKQTPVINADKFSNELFHISVQTFLFENYGLLYERKRGEFADGIHDGYITGGKIVERNFLWRLFYTANGDIKKGYQKKLFQKNNFLDIKLEETEKFDRLNIAIHVFNYLSEYTYHKSKNDRITHWKTYAYVETFYKSSPSTQIDVIERNLVTLEFFWDKLLRYIRRDRENISYENTQEMDDRFWRPLEKDYTKDRDFEAYLIDYFSLFRENDYINRTSPQCDRSN